MRAPAGRQLLVERIRAFVDASVQGRNPEESFEQLFLAAHRWQRALSPLLQSLGPTASHWRSVPAVPVDLFKSLRVGTVPTDAPSACFRTSGTTQGRRGEHHTWDTDLYDHAAPRWAAVCVPDAPRDVVALLHDPSEAPDSSLSHMVAMFGEVTWHLHRGVVQLESLRSRMAAATAPLYVNCTAFALADWLDDDPAPLPAGSVLMVTGGFKGRRVDLSDAEMYALCAERLRPDRLVTEYGMTELSSQLWGTPGQPYRPPPWMRVVAVDPITRQPLPAGETGQLCFYDLLNLDGSLAIATLDQGRVTADGSVDLDGRLPGAAVRGCSLTVEDAWESRVATPSPIGLVPLQPAGPSRLEAVRAWRDALRADVDLAPATGLSPRGQRKVLLDALGSLTDEALAKAVEEPGHVPHRLTFVAARTVVTAPIEWLALSLARGSAVMLKHPEDDPGLAGWLRDHAQAHDLPLGTTSDRMAVDDAPLVVVMGSDATVAAVRERAQGTVRGFGHRFSAVWWPSQDAARDIAEALAAHDSRGCMSPAVVFTSRPDAAEQLATAMAHAQARWPVGSLGPADHAATHVRADLSRALGHRPEVTPTWSVIPMAVDHASPVALPRSVQLVTCTEAQAGRWLQTHRSTLSTLGTPSGGCRWTLEAHTRVCTIATMQVPPLLRHHDGAWTVGAVSL